MHLDALKIGDTTKVSKRKCLLQRCVDVKMENTGSQRNVNDYNLGFYEKKSEEGFGSEGLW